MSESVRLITESPNNEALPARRGHGDLIEAAASVSIDDLRRSLQEMKDRHGLIEEFVRQIMVEGVDYGPPFPGSDKRTLLKPGGEKLIKLFGYMARPKVVQGETIVKLEQEIPFVHYVIETEVMDRNGRTVAFGYGSANSLEGKYRYRNAQRHCPNCEKETLLKSKDKPEFFCWAKKGGCGATFPQNDPRIINQVLGKVANEDVGGLHHTIMRIAKKRSFLDAAQIATGTSGIFEIDDEGDEGGRAAAPAQEQARSSSRGAASQAAPAADVITEAEQKTFVDTYTKAGHKAADVARYLREKHKVDISRSRIPRAIYDQVLKELADTSPLFEKGGAG
jgi:hypothetical protein